MRLLIPGNPLSLEFVKDTETLTLTMVELAVNEWNIQQQTVDAEPITLMKKHGTWYDAFKGLDKIVAQKCNEGWVYNDEGFCISLFCQEGGSDKEYHSKLEQKANGWTCASLYGRRGSTLKPTIQAPEGDFEAAWAAFRTVCHKKLGDGYVLSLVGKNYQVPSTHRVETSLRAMLLQESESLSPLTDDDYYVQEKFDGENRPFQITASSVIGTNRDGYQVSLNTDYEQAKDQLKQIGINSITLATEDVVGPALKIFDLLEINGENLRMNSFESRIKRLEALYSQFPAVTKKFMHYVPPAKTTQEKQEFYKKMVAERSEGLVFKRKNSPYVSGRCVNGDQLKYKFYATATVVVVEINKKRSVKIGLIENGKIVSKGNVTIGGAIAIPAVGDIIEIKYLYAYPGEGSVYQPSYIRVRNDKSLDDCQMSQLKYKKGTA